MSQQEIWQMLLREMPSADGLIELLLDLGKFASAVIIVVCIVWIIMLAIEQLQKK